MQPSTRFIRGLTASEASWIEYRLLKKSVGTAVRYRSEDLSTWLESMPTGGTQRGAE
jgi:hypothetical protein